MSIMDLFQLIGGGSPTTAEPTAVDPSVASTGYEAPPSAISALIGPGEVDWRRTIRAIGGGMANMGNAGGDPYLAFGQGFGGATNSLQERDDLAMKQEAAKNASAEDQRRWEAEMEIKRAAEERKAKLDEMQLQKAGVTEYDTRRAEAERIGMTPDDPRYDNFVLTGKIHGPSSLAGDKPPSGFRYTDETRTSLEPIPGGPGEQISAEQAARIGMARNFLTKVPELREKIAAGEITGPVDQMAARAGLGEKGQIYQQMQSGVDALIRYMTGAGMNITEAEAYASRYLPTVRDTADTAAQKLDRLAEELQSAEAVAMRGRGGFTEPALSGRTPTSGKTSRGVGWSIEE